MQKSKAKKPVSRIDRELLEMAKGMHRTGIIDDGNYRKITRRILGKKRFPGRDTY